MRKIKFLVLFLFAMLLVGCSKENNAINTENKNQQEVKSQIKEYKPFEEYTLTNDNNKEIVYHLYKQKLGIYDKNTFTWTPIRDIENEFFYNFDHDQTYFTVGHSINNKFSVLEAEGNIVSSIRDEKESECIFPLASSDEHYYYLQYADEEKVNSKRKIVEFYNGKFTTLLETEDSICYGVVVGYNLYYTIYNEEKDLYDIYCVDLRKEVKQGKNYKSGITDGKLFEYEDKLFYIDNNLICSDQSDMTFEKKDYNDINPDCALLVQMYSNKDGDLQWDFIDMENKEVLYSYINIINYKVTDTEIEIYCNGEIHHEKVR